MTFYSIVLFVHIAAVMALAAALTFEALSLFHLRRAVTLAEVRLWLEPVPSLPLATLASLLIVFCTGVYLTIRMAAFSEAWPKVSVAALLLVAPIAAVSGRRMRAIRRTCAKVAAINSDLRARLQDPVLKASLGVRIAVVLGIVLLMDAKPELWQSAGVIGGSFVIGLLSSLIAAPRSASLPASGGEIAD
jgi:hypothetical protein